MIVPVSSEKYDNLFSEATAFLQANGYPQLASINSLNTYYGHMKKFYEAAATKDPKGYKYIMMPLDTVGEEVFNIDLNSRSISVPKTFAAIGGVQADQMAELIVFSADRYFDYMDLANTLIYVQWQLPDDKMTTGATEITIKDYETIPGKIRFAWPLHNKVTSHSGIVKFSVRFFIFDENRKLAYSLNTLESSLLIRPALDPTETIAAENVNTLFSGAVLDSQYTHTGKIPPVDPLFEAPGMDMTILPGYTPISFANADEYAAYKADKYVESSGKFIPATGFTTGTQYFIQEADLVRLMVESGEAKQTRIAKLGKDDKLVMRAQAYVADAGELTYQWKYKAPGAESWSETLPQKTQVELIPVPAQLGYDVLAQKAVLDFKEKYYTLNAKGEPVPYTGYEVPVGADGKYDNSLYELVTQLTILPDNSANPPQVVGTYAVEARNTIDEDLKTQKKRFSSFCYLPGPAEVEFDEVAGIYTKVDNKKITVNTKTDPNTPDLEYVWFRSYESPEAAVNLAKNSENSNVSNLDPENFAPGWYAVKVKALLNRKTESKAAPIAEVIYPAATITSVEPADCEGDKLPHYELPANGQKELKVVVTTDVPDSLKNASDVNTALYRNLTYEWSYKRSDGGQWKKITSNMADENDPSKLIVKIDNVNGSITVRNLEDMTSYWYKCKVTNTLGKNVATLEQNSNKYFLVF